MNIPDKAIDAAADPIYDYIENLGGTDLEMARNIAYAAIKAATPHLVAQALWEMAAEIAKVTEDVFTRLQVATLLEARAEGLGES